MKRIVGFLLCVVLLLSLCGCNSQDYEKAIDLMRSEDFESAKVIFDKLGDYKDSAQKSQSCTYSMAMLAYNDGRYEEAKAGFSQIEDYKDAGTMCIKCDYNIAKHMLQNGKYEEAYTLFDFLGEYENSAEYAVEAKWGMLYQYIEENGTYHGDLEHKVLSVTVEGDSDPDEWIVYIYAESPDNIVIGNRFFSKADKWIILRLFSIDLEKGENEAVWSGSFGVSILGEYRIDAAAGGLRIDTCTKNTSLKAETFSAELKNSSGKVSSSTDTSLFADSLQDTLGRALEEVLTYVPEILKSTGLPIEMKDLGFLAVK